MPLNPFTLKQMKDGTLQTLRLQGQPLDERDYKSIGNFLRVTQSLKELDLSFTHGSLEQLAESIKQNRSITKLGVSQLVQDHNLPVVLDILKTNTGITEINMANCYMQAHGVNQLARFLKGNASVTGVYLDGVQFQEFDRYDRGSGMPKLETVTKALADNKNILHFSPATPEMDSICIANKEAAGMLLKNAIETPELLSKVELESIKTRLPSFLYLAENEVLRKKDAVAQLLVAIEDKAAESGIAFEIPERYVARAAALPRPFKPSEDKVDFTDLKPIDLAKPEPAPRLYQAVEAGQVDELMAFLKKEGMKLTADACLVKPAGKRENLIQLIARQGKLADVMTVDNWTGNPRGLKTIAETVPAREWQRQMKDLPLDRLISQVNAATFKKSRQPGVQPGGL